MKQLSGPSWAAIGGAVFVVVVTILFLSGVIKAPNDYKDPPRDPPASINR